ncbi:MAG TPA: family 78 glycoside hydrolase catalytic domain, partial [Burkholderiales bacterium]|nr:family 78 glycoside hydrolase catalytic domain [Burkholderiales bacterium]
VHPSANSDLRLLLDYGREVIGFQRFEIVAPEGTIVDAHNFEFIQPDGRYNFAEGMNNSLRYICREGYQQYQSLIRRGFQYSYLILRNMTGPVQIKGVDVLFNTYPQSRRGSFACADDKLQRIWEVGAHTLRLCAEDTYTDCPTYEQVHWVGDARNEALVDWVINGDARLWYRCLEQTGQSLDRSPLVESNVPSSWQNIIPAWTFLWMRSCREYLLFSGDLEKSRALLGFIERNVNGIEQHINAQGLFDIHAWNMFDWADMDTPADGVVTHQNCFAAHALRDASEMAEWLEEVALAERWRALADGLSRAINTHLWSAERNAYTDCSRAGAHSDVFSQQTQTVAVMSGVAGDHSAQRADQCRAQIHHPPDDFVKAGSPFFEFFLLEAYQQEGRSQAFIDTIRRDWGWMID